MTVAQMLGYYFVFKDEKAFFVTLDKNKATRFINAQEDKERYSIQRYASNAKIQEKK